MNRRFRRPRRLLAKHEISLVVLLALVPVFLTLTLSFLWTVRHIEHQMAFLADATARRSEKILKVTETNLRQLAEHTSARCDLNALAFMREKVFSVLYIREMGIINDNRLTCNDIQRFTPPVLITDRESSKISESDGEITIVPPVATLQGGKSMLVNYRVDARNYVNALIDPDLFQEFHEYVRLGEVSSVFLVRGDGKAVISFGTMSEGDLPPLMESIPHQLQHRGKLFSVYKSGAFPLYAVVASSPAFILRQWRDQSLPLGFSGLFISVALIALLKSNRRRRSLLQGELWQALENDELVLHYQPVIDMHSQRCVGAETLVRWQHPEQGLLMPLIFLPAAEQTGVIRALTHWVVRRVEWELGAFLKNNPDIYVSINLSPSDLGCDGHKVGFEDLVIDLVPNGQIVYEVTEQSLIPDHVTSANDIMQSLRRRGAKVALDDFGTGYSSLSYLHRFPVDYLKIDKAFVDGIEDEAESASLVDHIIGIGHSLQFQLIAEGIEHLYQMRYLLKSGVQFGQGFFFSRPLAVDEFLVFVRERNKEVM
ncbi:EAL domain-containing protein [Methyloterricola oryzae]|uniref:EAL domain-containing protein n=1 Tax=Methyloterricola oryzae TaxID=1495050 RepID=UPI0011AF7BCA|nr:EAL domain-containing protein [Methyloterricola oryzae]